MRINEINDQKFNDLCRIPLFLMRNLGIDLFDDKRWRPLFRWLQYYWILALSCTSIGVIFAIKNFITISGEKTKDYYTLTKIISNFIYVVGGTVKVLYTVYKRHKFRDLLERLRTIFPKDEMERGGDGHHPVEPMSKYFWPKWSTALILINLFNSVFLSFHYAITSVIVYGYQSIAYPKDQVEFMYLRPSGLTYTENDNRPTLYVFLIAHEYICGHLGIAGASMEIWVILFIMHLCMHFDDLSARLLHHRPKDTLKLCTSDQEFLANFVKRHILLLE